MSRKTNKLRSRLAAAKALKKGLVDGNLNMGIQICRMKEAAQEREKTLASANARIRHLENQLKTVEELKAIRVHVSQLEPYLFRRDVYRVCIDLDMWALEHGLMRSRNDPFRLSGQVAYIAEDLARRVERQIMEKLVEDKVVVSW